MEKDIMWYDFLVTVILTLMALKMKITLTLTLTPAAPPTQKCRRVTCIALCLISGSSV